MAYRVACTRLKTEEDGGQEREREREEEISGENSQFGGDEFLGEGLSEFLGGRKMLVWAWWAKQAATRAVAMVEMVLLASH